MPSWVEEGCSEYVKRMPRDYEIKWVEIPIGPRGKNADIVRAKQREGEQMLAAINDSDWVVALEVLGKPWDTPQLSQQLDKWRMSGQNVSILIGGPDGLAPEAVARANQKWSLSPLTLPHPLVRILLAEQLYRAHTILNNHPYHK